MNSPVLNRWLRSAYYPTNALLSTSLAAIVISTVGPSMALSSEKSVAATPSPSLAAESTPSNLDLVGRKLLGQWLTKEPPAEGAMIFLFSADGTFFIISDQSSPGKPTACQFQYQINSQSKPMQLDIILADKRKVQTIFELTSAGDLRVQMRGTQPGTPRPTELDSNATQLQKISDDTALPPNTELRKSCS